ncbi:MAG: AAA family ATPase [Phycisphaerae bacterium]
MRAVITGQVGLDKTPFLQRVKHFCSQSGMDVHLMNVGELMYAEAPDVVHGRILDLPLTRLNSLRRSVFKDILRQAESGANVIVNTHATFRWRHGLFYAFDYDQLKSFDADLYITVVDNIDTIHARLARDGHANHTLKDLMVWREEETLATELMSQIVSGHGRFYICARGADDSTAQAMGRLMTDPDMKKAYLSFPMSHVLDRPKIQAEIDRFRLEMKKHFICFDPGDVEEKYLCRPAIQAVEKGERTLRVGPEGMRVDVPAGEVISIIPDIDGQIYARDFKLIDQSDMIISLVPTLEDGRPGLSSGVERELQHAHEATRDVYVVWQPDVEPSPFITETATRVFRSSDEALRFLVDEYGVETTPAGGLFD